MHPNSEWLSIRADGSLIGGTAEELTERSRRARVAALWAEGKDTWTIGRELGIGEAEVCRLLRDFREMRRGG